MEDRPVSTRTALLAAASELLTRGGPDAVTLRDVGAMSGVSRTAPYRHFRDKDDLLSAVAAENLVFIGNAMREAADDADGGGSPLYRACVGYVRAAAERPAHYRLVFGDVEITNPSPALQRAADDCVTLLDDLVAQDQESGLLASGEVRDLSATIWATIHGLVDLTLTGHLREPRMVNGADAAPRLIALVLRGLSAPPAAG